MNRRQQWWQAIATALLVSMLPLSAQADPIALFADDYFKFPQDQAAGSGLACTGVGLRVTGKYWDRLDCGFGYVQITDDGTVLTDVNTPGGVVFHVINPNGAHVETIAATYREEDTAWEFDLAPGNSLPLTPPTADWPAGPHLLRVAEVDGVSGNFGEFEFFVNGLSASLSVTGGPFPSGDNIPVVGTISQTNETSTLNGIEQTGVPAQFSLEARLQDGTSLGMAGPFSAASDGTFSETVPGAFTAAITTSTNIEIRVVDASYNDAVTEGWAAEATGSAQASIGPPPPGSVTLHNSFVSSVGWVKPGESYPWRVFVENDSGSTISNAIVTIPAADGMSFSNVTPLSGAGTAFITGGNLVTWNIGNVPHAGKVTLVVEGIAKTAGQDPEIVWKDLSTTASLTWGLAGGPITDESHGPKVIPPMSSYNTARFGDRPYVVVPADYTDRKHDPANTGDKLEKKLNDPSPPTASFGSTFSLWQEMSFGQLYPHGAIGSAGVATADFTVDWKDPNRTDNEFTFSNNTPNGTCAGTDFSALAGTPAYPERISGGWYQLPRDTNYYGGDRYGTALLGALTGVGLIFAIDDACGPTGKAVYDAAHIADPEIDYNEFDTDKDGVVDFFMLVFVGTGGNGASQLSVPPYDNIWPHSSSLEFYFTDANGLKGYVSDDQLKSLEEIPQCWTNTTYTVSDDCAANGGSGDDALPVYVRVGPYNVNPEDSIENASVISHEYGHSLGLPDFYCTGTKSCYGDWNLMATDKSHHMDIFGKQELGWIVPMVLEPGQTIATDWKESKHDTGEIHWRRPDGTPYTLSAANGDQNIHNAEAYVAKLPSARVIDPELVNSTEPGHDASPDHVWWSGSGNDFGCPGHTFDFGLSNVEAPPGSTVTIEFGSWWEIEWDWDYGFVLVSTDLGSNYESLVSNNGYTTPQAFNPNSNGCQDQFGNGITGTSGSYIAGTDAADRLTGAFTPATRFTTDSYTFVMPNDADAGLLARFAYATDPAVAGRGWFIDNLRVSVDGTEVFSTDFEDGTWQARFADDGWSYISAELGSQADRAYYMEMRDRTGFDHTGNGENDRGAIAFQPGMLLVITDEVLGYGNTGSGEFPNQSPVDANPQPGNSSPNLNDAAFTASGVSHFNDITGDGDDGWHDNYADSDHPSGDWVHDHNCLSFDVTFMTGNTTIGPNYPIPGDLAGDVTFDLQNAGPANCGEFQYWPPPDNDCDADGVLDDVDICPCIANPLQEDSDGDGVGDACDNCTLVSNPDQCDSNLDGFGNLCDADLNDNNIVNSFDLNIMRENFGSTTHKDSDLNCNGITNSFDLQLMREMFGQPPGPSALAP